MPLPVVLELFGCGEQRLETPVSNPGLTGLNIYANDAMPLVRVPKETVLETLIAKYNEEFDNVDFQIGEVTERSLADLSGTVQFDEYKLTYTGSESQPVYAITTSYLHYLHDEKSSENLLSEAKPNPGETILVLATCDVMNAFWKYNHPGRSQLLEECLCLNFQMLDDEALRAIIRRTASVETLKQLYKDILKIEWPGTGDWDMEYLKNFKLYPEWPIVVIGGDIIAYTNPDLINDQQLLTMSFKVGGTWNAHYYFVKSFFKYHQRGLYLSGHPLIAKLMGYPVEAGTVDFIPYRGSGDFSLQKSKTEIISPVEKMLDDQNYEYHPLAIDPDEDPNALIVPKPPGSSIPPNLILRTDQSVTRLKIFNPFSLQITVYGTIPIGISITPTPTIFSAVEQVIEIEATADLALGTTETLLQISTGDGALIHELTLKYLAFKSFPIRFWKIIDQKINHITQIDETQLLEVISMANDILGRQANVFIYPIAENGIKLHDFVYDGDLGDIITFTALENMAELISNSIQGNEINILFVWQVTNDSNPRMEAANFMSGGNKLIVINTSGNSQQSFDMAMSMVHELGHWFSEAFVYPGNGNTIACGGSDRHFSHWQPDVTGCPGGDWIFYENLMNTVGSLLITKEQSLVFNTYADEIEQ